MGEFVDNEFLDFRTNLDARIPERLRRDSYKMLWGAGDFWVLTPRFFELYDVFVSYGETGGVNPEFMGNPPAEGLTSIENATDEVLIENRRRAYTSGKIIVYIDSNNADQLTAFANIFENSVTLFEELGVHNEIDGMNPLHFNMLNYIIKTGGDINLSHLDRKCDGLLHSRLNLADITADAPCNRFTGFAFDGAINAKRRELLAILAAGLPPNYESTIDFRELDLDNLIFFVGQTRNELLQNTFKNDEFRFLINNTPRLYSPNPVLRISIKRIFNKRVSRKIYERRRHALSVLKKKHNLIKEKEKHNYETRRHHALYAWGQKRPEIRDRLATSGAAGAGAAANAAMPSTRRTRRRRRRN